MTSVEGRSGGARRRGRALAIVATLLAPLLIYLAVRAAAGAMGPAEAMMIPPPQERPMLRQIAYLSLAPDQQVTAEMVDAARRGLAEAPLSFEPFIIAARHAEQAGDLGRAVRLLEEARRRRPNFEAARLQLLLYYGQLRRFDELFGEVEVVLRLSPDAQRLLLPELAKLVSDAEARTALAGVLARNPDWRRGFFEIAANRRYDPADALALYRQVREIAPEGDHRLERQLYIRSLVDAGRVREARALWLETLPPGDRARHQLLFNGAFSGIDAAPPFGWTFADNEIGRATQSHGADRMPHLEVDYFGGRTVVLAEQLLALSPGRHRLRYAARSGSDLDDAAIAWVVMCRRGDRELARGRLTRLADTPQMRELAFDVPAADCDGQRLMLLAEPGDVSAPVNLQISRLEILR